MGLFDIVRVELPVPDPEVQGALFQTKDLGCSLERYTITIDGRLVQESAPPARRGFSFYTSVGDMWYEYFAHLEESGIRIERVYVGPTKER